MSAQKIVRDAVARVKRMAGHSDHIVWTPKYLQEFRAKVEANERLKKARPQITDGMTPNLRARFEGERTAFYAHYFIGKERKQQLIGHFPEMSITQARRVFRIIEDLAVRGINIQDGLIPRVVKELEQHGTDWRPDGWEFHPRNK